MSRDRIRTYDLADLAAELGRRDCGVWRCHTRVDKFDGDFRSHAHAATAGALPYEVIERIGNLLMYGGASCQWQTLIGNGSATAGLALTYFNNAQAAIGVGDSITAAAATQTNLQAAANKLRKAMDATYPVHTDGTTSAAASIQFKSTFASADANFAWQEWGVFNSTTDAIGRMLNRKVESLGTKASGATWVLTVTLTLA